jgi:hypothetical protein
VSAEVLVNGSIAGRYPLFSLDLNGPYPFASTSTSFEMGQVPIIVSETFVSLINGIFGKTVFRVGTLAGSVGLTATGGTIP